MKFRTLFFLFIIFKVLPSYAVQRDTVRLFYDINKKDLTPRHKITLDSLGHFLTDTTTVRIRGLADYLGKRDSNYTLSTARAENVKSYLLTLHSKNTRMTADGKGQVDASRKGLSTVGEPFNRRVEIIFSKPVIAKVTPKKVMVARPRDTLRFKKRDDSVMRRIDNLANKKIGDSISFKELTFLPGRHFLRQSAVPYMVELKDYMKAHPNLKIEIQGHICCQYDGRDGADIDTHKNNLSLMRAKFIYDFLVSEGIDPQRMLYKGLGSKEPKVYPELSADDQDQNRRVVIVLTGK